MSSIKRDTPRPIKFTPNINPYAYGSVMAEFGNTKVHITASVQESVPPFLKGKGQGWLTAEYAMLPSATHTRSDRERKGASGRTQEIQRLIGRALRSVVDMSKLGERTIMVDCDVIVADGGTRTTSISGAYIALEMAVRRLMKEGLLKTNPIKDGLCAVSIGINSKGEVIADLNYEEDSSCDTDMNIVMTTSGKFVEVQGTAEKEPFSMNHLTDLLACAQTALKVVIREQQATLESLK